MSGMMPNVSAGGPHPPSMPMPPSQHSSADLVDPATKFKLLVPPLKEALQKIMANAATVFYQNSQFDSCQKTNSAAVQRFDKSLEEFYAICDQIELHLMLSLDVLGINADCQRNTPICAGGSSPAGGMAMRFGAGVAGTTSGGAAGTPAIGSPVADLPMYTQYQAIVKSQLACAKDIHDALVDCARKIGVDRPGGGHGSS